MRRREFIALVGGAATAWPFTARSQQLALPVIGFLGSSSKAATQQSFGSFSQGMRELGYEEERNCVIEQRYADGTSSRLPQLAQDLLNLQPKVIVADSTPGTLATKRATPTTPIVGLNLTDPVGLGLVASEAHPGTNVTGTLIRVEGLPGKLLEIAVDLVPRVNKIGFLLNAGNPSNIVQRRETEAAATRLAVSFEAVRCATSASLVLRSRRSCAKVQKSWSFLRMLC